MDPLIDSFYDTSYSDDIAQCKRHLSNAQRFVTTLKIDAWGKEPKSGDKLRKLAHSAQAQLDAAYANASIAEGIADEYEEYRCVQYAQSFLHKARHGKAELIRMFGHLLAD